MKLNGMLAGIALAGAVIMTFPGYAIAAGAAPAKQSPSDAYSKGGSDFSMSDPKAAGRGGEIYATVCAARAISFCADATTDWLTVSSILALVAARSDSARLRVLEIPAV